MTITVENIVLLSVLVIAVVTDIRSHRVPNWLTLPAIIAGVGLNLISGGASGLLLSIGGLVLGMGLFIIFYMTGGMGAGDVKLMGAVGAMLGPQMVLMAALCTAIAGGIYALAIIMLHPRAKAQRTAIAEIFKNLVFFKTFHYNKPKEEPAAPKLCYAVAIAVGTAAAVFTKGFIFTP